MYSQLVQAVLRLLPGNLNQSPDNPIQLDRLGDTSGVELDFPVYQDPPEVARRRLGVLVFVFSLVAPLLAWAGDLIPFTILSGGANTLVLLAASALIVYGVLGKWWPLAAIALAIAALPIVAMLVRDVPFALGTLFIVGLAQIIFADSLVTSFLYLKTAAPLSRPQSVATRSLWNKRFYNFSQPIRGSELYLLGGLVMLPAGWLVLRHLARNEAGGDFAKTATLFLMLFSLGIAWFLALENLIAPLYGRRSYSLLTASKAMLRALTAWCNYNRLKSPGAGVHQSPAGLCAIRRSLLIGIIIGWGCLWAGLQIGAPRSSFDWFMPQVAAQTTAQSAPSNAPPSNVQPLTPDEEAFLRMLPPAERAEYVEMRLVRPMVKASIETTPELNEKAPQSLIVDALGKLAIVFLHALVPSVGSLFVAFALSLPMAGRAAAGIEQCFGDKEPERYCTTKNWESLVNRLRSSKDSTEQDSVLMGVNSRDDTPVLVPRSVFREHAHVLGDTGSGKTSRGLAPLLTQLMRFNDSSVIVIDLKAEGQSLFETLRKESLAVTERLQKDPKAAHREYPFRWFTTVLGCSSFAFNPLAQSMMPKLSPDQRTDIITAALGLQYGSDYGRKYFGDANYDVLNYALRKYPNVQSLAELEQILLGTKSFELPEETKKAGTHVRTSARRLARIKALNACPAMNTPQPVLDNAIDLAQVFSQPQAIYLALPPSSGISNTAEIARIFLYSLLASAQAHVGKRTQVFIVIDEFQRIVSNNVELFLQQARSMNIGCILSNQSLADLESVGADLIPAVRTNTRFRQIFGAGYQTDIEDILNTSGETTYGSRSWNYGAGMIQPYLQGFSISETRNSRLSLNDILLATDADGRNIACVRRGAGYAQFGGMPFIMDSVYHISVQEYDKRNSAEWPEGDERTLVATLADTLELPEHPKAIILESVPSPAEINTTAIVLPEHPETDGEEAISDASAEGLEFDPLEMMRRDTLENMESRARKARNKTSRRKPPQS